MRKLYSTVRLQSLCIIQFTSDVPAEWGNSMVIVIDEWEVGEVPENLEDFFESFPSIGRANLELTGRDHVNMWRDQVLFIRQRQQATSDFRENPKVRWIGRSTIMK